MQRLGGIIDSMDLSLSKLREMVKGSLVFTDAAGDDVLYASVVLKKASVWPGHPVQEVRKDIVHLRMEQSWRGWEEQAAAETVR